MQNDMRDRLIELYKEATTLYFDYLDSIDEKGLTDTEGRAKFTIDHLIENGVIIPPCNVGDTVYQFDTAGVIYQSKIKNIIYDTDGVAFDERAIGNSIFLTKAQAEQKLKELNK